MLIILTITLVAASVLILCVKKSRESMYMFGLCLSLMLEICGVMIFIAKKGGVSQEVMRFLYISPAIRVKIQYFLITLNQLGFLIALGRTLFPFFLLELSMCYSMIPLIRKNTWIQKAAAVLPAVALALYIPGIYRVLCRPNAFFKKLLVNGTLLWITAYLLAAVALLVWEYYSITMKFCKRQFCQISVSMVALTGIYLLYYQQDPGQVYHFYSDMSLWSKGVGYLQVDPSLFSYCVLVIVSIICCIFGFYSLLRYTSSNFAADKEDVIMERKFDTARVGVSMFVHSMKNQLLSGRVIYKRIGQLYEQPQVDVMKVREYVDVLEDFNNTMLLRMEELYRCVKANAIYMVPVPVEEIAGNAVERFHKKYPEAEVEIKLGDVSVILADKVHFCEALYNLLVNAQEAVIEAGKQEEGRILLQCRNERLYTVIEVRDNGCGMAKGKLKKVFDPFFTSKNSNYNWGMGLYYVREIVKSHLGSLRVESREGEGSSFCILLPRYQ